MITDLQQQPFSLADKATILAPKIDLLSNFIGTRQLESMLSNLRTEKGEWFYNKILELAETIEVMPQSYETEGAGLSAIAHLRYHAGDCQWHVTEKDRGAHDDAPEDRGKQNQAYGFSDTGFGSSFGYISIQEIISEGGTLDLNWKPQTLEQIKNAEA